VAGICVNCLCSLCCLSLANSVIEASILTRGGRLLEQRLPSGWKVQISAVRGVRLQPDAVLRLVSPDGVDANLAVKVREQLYPRDVPELKRRLEFDGPPGLVVTEFLTLSARRRLREEGLNYLDLTGNLRLILSRPGVFIETEGATSDPNPREKTGRSLRGAKAGRIVRALCDFAPPLPVSDLALKAGVDVSYASRLVDWLAREDLVQRVSRGPVEVVDRARMIRRWADDYEVLKSNRAIAYLDPRGFATFLRRLPTVQGRYAVTGSLAAVRLAPIAPPRLAMVYLEDPEGVADELGLTATERGANTMLLVPFDEVVFERTRIDEGIAYVAPSQAAVDLLTGLGRSPAEGEAVLEWMGRNPAT
jgi:hypothetical protein